MTGRLRIAAAMAFVALAASAQDLPPGTIVSNASLSGIAQFDTDLDSGGRFRWSGALAYGSALRQWTKQFAAGISVQYDFQQWHFDNPAKFGGVAPWRNIDQPQIGAMFVFAPAEGLEVTVAPAISWAYANGASTGDAQNYGAVVIVAKDFSPTLSLGLGASVFRQIDQTKVYPFLAIEWQIDDRWKLSNPFQAGPAGGAGLELTYAFAEGWEAGFGGTYRSFTFRLDQSGPVPDGIGEQTYLPVFFRLSRTMSKQAQFDLYAAGLANGTLKVKNSQGAELASDDYRLAPAVALTFRYRF